MGWLTIRVLLVLLFIELAWGLKGPDSIEIPHENRSANPMGASDGHVLPNLEYKPRQHDLVFIEAAHILESMKFSPSCNKIAATRLITSCQSLGGKYAGDPLKDEYETLDRIRSMYAARLAICELQGAGAAVPPPCIPVTVNAPSTSSFRIPFMTKAQPLDTRNDLVPDEVLGPCLKTLESRPQSWTSYSNNRQNAMIICQATRIELEREELLDLHQKIVKTSSKLHQGLEEALRSAAMETSQHDAFLNTLRAMQDNVSVELQASASVTQIALEGLLQAIELSLTKITASAASTINSLRGNANSVVEDIQHASESVRELQDALRGVQEDTASRSQQLVHMHEEDTLAYREVASTLHSSLESIVDKDMARLYQRMMTFDASLEWMNSRMALVLEQENKMSERLQTMEVSIQRSQDLANYLKQAQNAQAEALAEVMTKSELFGSLIDKATITAAGLHSVIDEAAVKFKRTPGLHSGGVSIWMVCAILLVLVGAQNMRIAISLLFLILGHIVATFFFHFL